MNRSYVVGGEGQVALKASLFGPGLPSSTWPTGDRQGLMITMMKIRTKKTKRKKRIFPFYIYICIEWEYNGVIYIYIV